MKIKTYIRNFNGVMDGILKREEIEQVNDPRDAQVIVLWQDVRGEYAEIAKINKKYLKKPLIVVQHGVGGTRDYEHPENFPLLADKFCCWGKSDLDRLKRQGNGDRAVMVGCPMLKQLKPKEEHYGKNIVFCPIVTEHEEPANIITYYELKKIELAYSQKLISNHKDSLTAAWKPSIINADEMLGETTIPYVHICKDFRLISKLTPIHDKNLYHGSIIQTSVTSPTHIEDCVKLLANTDIVIGMVESTFQMLAMAMDIPVIISREWEFKIYAGRDYTHCDHIKTDAATYAETGFLRKVIEGELLNPERLREQRKKIVQRELGDLNSDPNENILNVIKGVINA